MTTAEAADLRKEDRFEEATGRAPRSKKREAKAKARADPTFETVSSVSLRLRSKDAQMGGRWSSLQRLTEGRQVEVRLELSSGDPAGSPDGDPKGPAKFASRATLADRRSFGFDGMPKGNRPGPQGLGRNPLQGTAPRPHRPGVPDRGQWGLAAMPAPVRVFGARHARIERTADFSLSSWASRAIRQPELQASTCRHASIGWRANAPAQAAVRNASSARPASASHARGALPK